MTLGNKSSSKSSGADTNQLRTPTQGATKSGNTPTVIQPAPSPPAGSTSLQVGSGISNPGPTSKHGKQPQNVFSNDGSFLERFQRLKRDEQKKKKEEEILERKKHFAERFKTRGKRPHSDITSHSSSNGTPSSTEPDPESPSKKPKVSSSSSSTNSLNEYQKEMKNMNTGSLAGEGNGVRPLVK